MRFINQKAVILVKVVDLLVNAALVSKSEQSAGYLNMRLRGWMCYLRHSAIVVDDLVPKAIRLFLMWKST
jgi:hypothetical protein